MKKILLFFVCASMFLVAKAQFSGIGSGTSEDPYQITTADELAEMSAFLGENHKGTYFKLMNDIDLSDWIADNNPTGGWNPIGAQPTTFMNVFDGDNHTIKGFYCNRPNTDNVGLWGIVQNASIKNIRISGTQVVGKNMVGGIVGQSINSDISNCNVSIEEITASENSAGGIVGWIKEKSDCSLCKHQGTINGKNNVGGIVGLAGSYSWSIVDTINIIKNSHSGTINGVDYIGGILGKVEIYTSSTKFTPCIINLMQCKSIASINGALCVGGILGYDKQASFVYSGRYYYYSFCDINDCYHIGNIVANERVGGIVGEKNKGTISRCYTLSKISGGTGSVGGIVGYMQERSIFNSNCAIVDSITANRDCGRIYGYWNGGEVGTLGSQQANLAYGKSVVIINGEEQEITDDEQNGSGVGYSTLRNPNTYIGLGWDFTNIWTINNGETFPYLQREKRVSTIALSKTTATMTIGETMTIEASITPQDADYKSLQWSSSNENIVTITEGVVTAIAEGTATISATAQDGSETSATCVISVSDNRASNPADFDNVVYMESFSAELGDNVELPILMKNQTAGDITGFDFYLYLPEGITPVLDEEGFPVIYISGDRTTTRKHAIYGDIEENGVIHIYTSASRPTYTFSGTTGEVATIAIQVADDAPNGVHQVVLRNISMESASAESPFDILRYNFSASIGKLSINVIDGNVLSAVQDKVYDELNFTRTFNNTKWQALYVPFSIPLDTLTKYGLEVAELNNIHMYDTDEDGSFDKTTLEFLYLKRGATEPNYPYLIKASVTGEVSLTLKDVEVKATEETEIECSSTRKRFKIKGTYAGVSGSVMYNNHYYAMGGGTLVQMLSAEDNLKPQRWYMSIENKDGSPMEYYAPSLRIAIDGIELDEQETGITSIDNEQLIVDNDDAATYNLMGQRVNKTVNGLYIKNNKKMIVQ